MLVRTTYDTHGVRQTRTQLGPVPEAIYDSPDDTIEGRNVYAADSSGRFVNDILYNSAGPNGIWGDADEGTADDTFPSASHLRYDLGHLTGMVTSAAKVPTGCSEPLTTSSVCAWRSHARAPVPRCCSEWLWLWPAVVPMMLACDHAPRPRD